MAAPLYNFFDELRNDVHFNKFVVDDLLFIEYNCPLENEEVTIWSRSDYIIYVLSGKKTWITPDNSYTVTEGQALYVKKGVNVIRQHLEQDFCMLAFFISEDIIQNTIKELSGKTAIPHSSENPWSEIVRLKDIPNLDSFYQSMLSYFRYSNAPMSSLLELKAKELLIHIVSSGLHDELAAYFNRIAHSEEVNLRSIMEKNYAYALRIEEFAQLSNRSLSSFKRDFKQEFGTTPGAWLKERRLKRAANLLVSTDYSISDVALESGFDNIPHFSRAFKDLFGVPPSKYRGRN